MEFPDFLKSVCRHINSPYRSGRFTLFHGVLGGENLINPVSRKISIVTVAEIKRKGKPRENESLNLKPAVV